MIDSQASDIPWAHIFAGELPVPLNDQTFAQLLNKIKSVKREYILGPNMETRDVRHEYLMAVEEVHGILGYNNVGVLVRSIFFISILF